MITERELNTIYTLRMKLKSFESYGKGDSSSLERKSQFLHSDQLHKVISMIDDMVEQNRLQALTDYRAYVKEDDHD